jgi:carbon monoxide dehydrogenase subunit G
VQVSHEFSIRLPPEQAYRLLLDLEQVTPCMPGAQLGSERQDGSRAVTVTVKLGPMRFVYDGTVSVSEQNETARRAVLFASARETRGQGSAQATITMAVTGEGEASEVSAVAEIELTGRAAQMGRGVVDDVAKQMIADMAACLTRRFVAPEAPEAGPATTAAPVPLTPEPQASEAPPIKAGTLFLATLWRRITARFRRRS